MINGGRRHRIYKNKFNNITGPYVVRLGVNRSNPEKEANCKPGHLYEQQLKAVNYQQPPWSKHYPWVVNIMHDYPCIPVYNEFIDNEFSCSKKNENCTFISTSQEDLKNWFCKDENNLKPK